MVKCSQCHKSVAKVLSMYTGNLICKKCSLNEIEKDGGIKKELYEELKKFAKQKKYPTYEDLAIGLGISYGDINERNKFHNELGKISQFEVANDRPALSAIVIHKNSDSDGVKRPGKGIIDWLTTIHVPKDNSKSAIDKIWYTELKKIYNYWSKHL